MVEYVLAPQAQQDILEILDWSEERFGASARSRYRRLIQTALEAVASDPLRLGSMERPELAKNCRTFHFFHCRRLASRCGGRVRKPRHFLLYRTSDDRIEIARVLHDSMDLQKNLPDEYRRDAS